MTLGLPLSFLHPQGQEFLEDTACYLFIYPWYQGVHLGTTGMKTEATLRSLGSPEAVCVCWYFHP